MIRTRSSARLVLVLSALACAPSPPLEAQATSGWISVLRPAEWSGERTRGIVVRRRNSIRIEGMAHQPGGVSRVVIDGTEASLEPLGQDQVRFVGYAHSDSTARDVEIAVYGAGPVPPVVREYPYVPDTSPDPAVEPSNAWREGSGFEGERYAVVIGISDYADPAIGSLRYADDDARAVYDFLVSEQAGLGGFDPANIRLLIDAEADNLSVRTALTTFLRQSTERDVVLIYIAGHGAQDPLRAGDHYILTHDTQATNFAGSAISMDDISRYIGEISAQDVLFFTDACHSGAVGFGDVGLRAGPDNEINRLFLERLRTTAAGRLTFTASEARQYSQEAPRWGGGHGVFTYELLRGLRGAADADRDGIVTLGEMVDHTETEVRRETGGAQIPQSVGNFDRSWPMAIADPEVVAQLEAPSGAPLQPVRPPLSGQPADEAGATPGGAVDPGESAARRVDLMNPATTFAHSLVIPGSGQFRTGRGWRGTLVLLGSVGAVGYGYLHKNVTRQCREATVGGECLSGQYTNVETERPDLVAGLVTAGALTVIGAVDAMLGASSVNRDRLEDAGLSANGPVGFVLLPARPTRSTRSGDVRLLELRFR